ncbi:hypothetical protein F3Y22_tig00004111pilonHSYRG00114 [Hibiscus syriacus]|uniref:Uncharacterized protein n=1 Tax=Hibiscus syriacus TaxID=106335 RepID=A0A6A3CNA2_HIBSY|nr:uncharacterized protein LOC120190754 [Hibiscus syriacus]KAE8728708.1 hypothetical protein F3Y22_tig00004111pilonHSYRG00114 [Hibiscus syriacus]
MASCQLMAPQSSSPKSQSSSQIQTQAEICNKITYTLTLEGKKIWKGDQSDLPDKAKTIARGDKGTFTHLGSDGGSYGAVVYKIQNESKKWVVAWKNLKDKKNKVYTEITDQSVKWNDVKDKLDTEGSADYDTENLGYIAEVKIEADGNSPNMTAYIEPDSVSMAK